MPNYKDDEPKLQTIDVNTRKAPKNIENRRKSSYEEEDYYEDRPVRKSSASSSRKKKKKKNSNKTARNVTIAICVFLVVVFAVVLAIYLFVMDKINRINKYEEPSEKHTYTGATLEDRELETLPEGQEEETYDPVDIASWTATWINGSNEAKEFFNNNGEIAQADYVQNILLIGVDKRADELDDDSWPGNADTNILVSINYRTKKITLTSFMRDMLVYDSERDVCDKLNSTHSYGDATGLMKTLEGQFKIKVDRFIRVNFYSLIDIIDAAGGIDMTVSEAERNVLNAPYIWWMCYEAGIENPKSYYLTESGDVHLTGIQAVAYARIRYVGNADYERTERQRKVISAIMDNCRKMNLFQLNAFIDSVLPKITTNMTDDEILAFVPKAVDLLGYEFVSQRVPFDDTSTPVKYEGKDVLIPDYKTNAYYLIESIYGEK